MSKETSEHTTGCPECKGVTLEIKGKGSGSQYKLCTRWKDPGHLSKDKIQEKYSNWVRAMAPRSGRFA